MGSFVDSNVWDLTALIEASEETPEGFVWNPLAASEHFTAALVTVDGQRDVEASGPGDHVHDDHDTFDVILAGEAQLEIDGELVHLRAGQAVFIPAGVPHGFRGNGAMSLLSIYMPYLNPQEPGRRAV